MCKKIFRDYQISVIYFAGECRPDKGRFLTEIEKLYGGEFWMEFRFLETENDTVDAGCQSVFMKTVFFSPKDTPASAGGRGRMTYISEWSALHTDAKEVHQAYDEALKDLQIQGIRQRNGCCFPLSLQKKGNTNTIFPKKKRICLERGSEMQEYKKNGNGY